MNFLTDAVLQPLLATCIDVTLWLAVFHSSGAATIGGFTQAEYLGYVIWAAFVARITISWMYEYKMIEEIESGTVNSLLVRPFSFFEYYFSQFIGYKLTTSGISLIFPLVAVLILKLPTHFERLPLALALVMYYLLLLHTLSFLVATLAFRFNKVWSFTMAKNLVLVLLSGELFPLDLFPEPWKHWLILSPFSSSVYIPVAYIAGRADLNLLLQGFASTTAGIAFFGASAYYSWNTGLRQYSGTGA